MAVTPNTDEAFLREVDEELRRDQLASAWSRYGRWLIGAIAVALVALGGVLYWQYHGEQNAGEQGEKLQKIYNDLGAQKTAAVQAPLAELAGSNGPGYRAMARFTQADMLLQKGDLKGAAGKFAEVAGDSSIGQPLRDLALIRQTNAEFDTLKPQVIVDRLRTLAVKGGPWLGSAGELVGAAYLKMNQRDLAASMFKMMAEDENVPESLRQRALQIAGTMGVNAASPVGDKKAQ